MIRQKQLGQSEDEIDNAKKEKERNDVKADRVKVKKFPGQKIKNLSR
jgi:hypothetical protein